MPKRGFDLDTVELPRHTDEDPESTVKEASPFRVALPQVLASTAKNLLLLDLGLTIAFPTIAIGALRNAKEGLTLNDEEASWFGSIAFICQPLGSIMSGMLLEPLGRKKAMILVNFPHILGWFLFYSANSVTTLYVTSVIMGLGVGFMEAPILTYVGEISQPKLRGILTSYSAIFVQLGFFLEYLLGSVTDWRTAAAISAVVPICTVLAITQVPETPMWLLSKGRVQEAEKALCWLRGWVQPEAVKEEFQEMVSYSKEINKKSKLKQQMAGAVVSEDNLVANDDSFLKKLSELRKRQTLRPLCLIICFFFFQNASALPGIRPYLVQVFQDFGLPLDAHWSTVVFALLGIFGNVACMILVKWTGKKPLSLISLGMSALCCISLGLYAYNLIPPGGGNKDQVATWIPLTLFVLLSFLFSLGLGPIPWMLLSEIFPFKTRGYASGIAAAFSYVLIFTVSKTFLSLRTHLHLHGVFLLYGIISCIGFLFLFRFLKETEGKSLEAIEDDYKKKKKGTENLKGVFNEGLQVSTLDLTKENGLNDIAKISKDEHVIKSEVDIHIEPKSVTSFEEGSDKEKLVNDTVNMIDEVIKSCEENSNSVLNEANKMADEAKPVAETTKPIDETKPADEAVPTDSTKSDEVKSQEQKPDEGTTGDSKSSEKL